MIETLALQAGALIAGVHCLKLLGNSLQNLREV